MKKIVRVWVVLISVQFFNACLFNKDDEPDFTKHHDSYVTLLEYHAYKQVIMYDFYELFSDGFTNSTLFENTPGDSDIDDFFEKIETLLSYEEALNEAINVLQQKSTASYNANDYLLKSVMADWDWLLKYVPFKGENIELRNKILSKTMSMSNEQRELLFAEVRNYPAWTGNASDADDFFVKMENGDLDNSIHRLHHTFKQADNDYLKWTDDNNLGSAQLAFDYGKEALEAGQKVMVTTVKNINPAVGKSIDILEKGNQFLEYINQAMGDKSFNQLANDANTQIAEKYANSGLDDEGESTNQKTLSVVESAQLLTKTALVNSDPVSIENTDFDWGGVKLNNEDDSLIP
ncbi:MAG TPA: hypothetical protein VJ909_08990, partial [Prolixibacteraceae bacterium]|nr:hypothetical protein [Prolixibacteraceae bacterium]